MALILSILLGLLVWAAPHEVAAATQASAVPCGACHADVETGRHPHFQAGADAEEGAGACVSCHVDAEGHPGAGDIMTFAAEGAAERSAVCASCHQEQHAGTGLAEHGRADVACSDCHRVHGAPTAQPAPAGFESVDRASATCVGCHEDVFVQFAFNERHRLAEGAVACTSCHDPHQLDGGRDAGLGAFGQGSCADCHADAAGPFVFEHAASRVEGCVACHEPHGSPNRHLLTHQQEGELCYSCHAMVPQFHTGFGPGGPPRFGLDTVCTNCHTAIHGSNFDRNYLR